MAEGTMKRILFVDDETKLLDGLQRMLRPQRKQWEMAFANTGEEALAILSTAPFDVIITDMRMPEMDGAALLERVKQRFPNVIRIVLSGCCEKEAALRAVPVAHQFLAKPCDPEKLREAVERCCSLSTMLPDIAIRRVIGAIGELPCLSMTCAKLMETLEMPNVPLQEIGKIIEQDVGITAKVLQLVNSAFFGRLREVTSVRMAVSYLGLDTLKQLILSAEIFRTFHIARPIPGFSMEDFQHHSQLAARISARFPASKSVISAAVVAALLHDTGKLVMAARLPGQFTTALMVSAESGRPLHAVEQQLTGVGHAEVGAYLLGLWGLPVAIVDAVCRHHQPSPERQEEGLDVLAITHIADALALDVAGITPLDAQSGRGLLRQEYLQAIGVAEQISEWRSMAQAVLAEQTEI
jgi:HD-like signal output (HDOD) protein